MSHAVMIQLMMSPTSSAEILQKEKLKVIVIELIFEEYLVVRVNRM